ncbi:integral membrane protein, partial [mine drainage metagenome]
MLAALPLLCATLSGAAGLLYQVLWNRELLLLFGSTSAAVAAVVAAFMAGMSLGAWGIGRLVDGHRGSALALYAACELGIAGYALAFSPLLSALQAVYPGLWHAALGQPVLLNVLRLGLGVLMLALPTLLMGATVPLLVEASQRSRGLAAQSVGWLYGL